MITANMKRGQLNPLLAIAGSDGNQGESSLVDLPIVAEKSRYLETGGILLRGLWLASNKSIERISSSATVCYGEMIVDTWQPSDRETLVRYLLS
jgi:hypothetical protein